MNIYVGNFSYQLTEDELRDAFAAFGEVASVKIIKDRYSDVSRGFGFVEMLNRAEAQTAMDSVKEIKGRPVIVNEARPKTDNKSRNSHGGQGGSRRGGSSGGGGRGWR